MKVTEEGLPRLRMAFVKQDVYQDLYVVPASEHTPSAILFSSMGRVGPIGLMADLGADFYIVEEEFEIETQIYRKVVPGLSRYFRLLKTETLDKIPGQEFKRPGSPVPQGEYAVRADSVDWGQYDVVISVNVSLPTGLVRRYPQTLFAYMIGEANMATHKARFGYDVTLNQMARGIVAEGRGEVDFPYTFLRGDTPRPGAGAERRVHGNKLDEGEARPPCARPFPSARRRRAARQTSPPAHPREPDGHL